MSSTNKTPNYDLPQWVASDPVEMADFNQAMSDIDTNLNLVELNLMPVSGSNANGSYTKFPDGTLICWGQTAGAITFPVQFKTGTVPSITGNAITTGGTSVIVVTFEGTTNQNSYPNKKYWTGATFSTAGESIHWQAIGKWK